jgi:hypothetical protein
MASVGAAADVFVEGVTAAFEITSKSGLEVQTVTGFRSLYKNARDQVVAIS